ncbi:MAG: Trm112 family protein [Candidatus Krumholzibacteriota bacterium]|nr:Trm112 family protein [Candidatus Krumholzibacteriota bacterium]
MDKELLDILACPKCKEKVSLDAGGAWLVCEACRLRYPVEEDIPIMLVDRAEPLDG